MNYRHAYHAGNFADVVKHAVLTLLLRAIAAKHRPFCCLDSHAGIGRYDLSGPEASKTGEWREGIGRLMAAPDPPPLARPYLDLVRQFNPGLAGGHPRTYPGSPRLARALLRPGDRLLLAELHPTDSATLRAEFRGDEQVAVHHRDGYEALKALVPPIERRGLALVDPPFEAEDEFRRMVRGVAAAHRRWPTGVYALWYPVKDRAPVERFHRDLADTGIARILAAELTLWPETGSDRLNGCGMILVNPPWRVPAQLGELLPGLHVILTRGGGGSRLVWLTGSQ